MGLCKTDKGTLRARVKGGRGVLGRPGWGEMERWGKKGADCCCIEVKHWSRLQDLACPMFQQCNPEVVGSSGLMAAVAARWHLRPVQQVTGTHQRQ